MRFSEWMSIKEQQMQQNASPMSQPIKKPIIGKDKTLDNVKNILKKSEDPKSPDTIKKISQIYDAEIDKATDGAQIGNFASKKSSVINNLLK